LERINDIGKLKQIARAVRADIIRMTEEAGSGHPGGSLSITDVLVVLYFSVLRHKPDNPDWEDRDIVILSKGHACPAFYSVLARSGYFPVEELLTLRKLGSRLQGHPAKDKALPGIEVSSGSLGQGLSVATGAAIGLKYVRKKPSRVFCILGDGELEEGQVWEAAATAGHYKLDNLCAIVDNNNLQIDGHLPEVKNIYPIDEKFKAFQWETITIDGHNYEQILSAFNKAKRIKGKPVVIIAKTIKGKDVSFMEDAVEWHGKAPSKELAEKALNEIKKGLSND